MKLTAIKEGVWYETRSGIGKAVKVGGTFPPSVKVQIVAPFPIGTRMLNPRDVLRQLRPDELPPEAKASEASPIKP